MKILFVNNFRGRGGGEEFLRDLLPGLVATGRGGRPHLPSRYTACGYFQGQPGIRSIRSTAPA